MVLQLDIRCEQVLDGVDDSSRREVASRIVVSTYNEDAGVMAADLHDQIVEFFEVVVVPADEMRSSRTANVR